MRFNFVNLACVRNYFNPEILMHRVFMLMAAYEMESHVRSYHIYQDIWAAMIEYLYEKENHSMMYVDRYADFYKIFSILIYFMCLNFN